MRDLRERRPKADRQARELGGKAQPGWDRQEARLARDSGGRRTRGSGSGNDKGDVHFSKDLLVEAKHTSKASMQVQRLWLEKISGEALARGKTPALAIEFEGMPLGVERDWIAVPKPFLLELLGAES